MRGATLHTLFPERCDQCGRCVRACPKGGLKVGAAYIAVDRDLCDGCNRCVDACDRDAIVARIAPATPSASASSPASNVVPLVDVGSRAEAKALRKAAVAAEKSPAVPAQWAAGVAPWTMVDVAAVIAILIAAMLAKNAILDLRAVALMPAPARAVMRAVVLTAYYAAQLGAFAFLARRHASGLLEAFGLRRAQAAAAPGDRPNPAASAGWVLLLFFCTEAFAIAYGLSMEALRWAQPQRLSSDISAVFGSGGGGLVLAALLVAFAAPLIEELAFRGVMLPAFNDRWGMWPAVMASSALYAAFHFSVWMFAPTMVLGIALAWLTITRRSLVPAIALHVMYNAAAVTAAYLVAR